jgi:carboxylesterase type B
MGATHATEVGFVWNDPSLKTNPERTLISDFMSRAWASFIVDQDPNNHGIKNIPLWEPYSKVASGHNFVIDERGFWTENDTFRNESIAVIMAEIMKL